MEELNTKVMIIHVVAFAGVMASKVLYFITYVLFAANEGVLFYASRYISMAMLAVT
jgi:hypothetical protein